MDALVVQGKLVHAQFRVDLGHEVGVAVTSATVGGHRLARGPAPKAGLRGLREVHVVDLGVAAVAVCTTEPFVVVYVILEDQTRAFHDGVAAKAVVFGRMGAIG